MVPNCIREIVDVNHSIDLHMVIVVTIRKGTPFIVIWNLKSLNEEAIIAAIIFIVVLSVIKIALGVVWGKLF